jgi:hypothetical protein
VGIEIYPDQLEPEDPNVVIWRFMDLWKFRNLMTTGELFFCRADKFNDEREGLPPEKYLATLGLNPFDINERQQLIHTIGSDAQFRQSFYVTCWHLFREETCKMWKDYGDGVAVCSRYVLLKATMNTMSDRAYIGLVRYGSEHLIGKRWNLFRLITTKRMEYAAEQEVRAFLWITDPLDGGNRHIDENNRVHPLPLIDPPANVSGYRRKVDLKSLLTGVVVSPWASSTTLDEVRQVVTGNGYSIPVQASELTQYRSLLPC